MSSASPFQSPDPHSGAREEPARELRVAVLRNQFLPYSETFVHDELRSHERYRPTVLARRVLDPERFPDHEVVAIETRAERHPLASLWYGLSARSRAFDRALTRGDFSLIHAHFGHNGAYALDFAKRHQLPLVVSMHGHDVTVLLGREKYEPKWWFYLARYRRLFREAALILPASRELRDLLVQIGCPPAKLSVHRLGVDIEALERIRSQTEAPNELPLRVTMVGRFVEKKGHEYGIRALALLRKTNAAPVELTLIGDGPLRAHYERLIDELGLSRVRLTGALEHAAVLRELARSSVLLAPSVVAKNLDRESGLIVAKEASALGVPVIGTLHGGLPEIVTHGETGCLVPERDPEALAEALQRVLGNRELRCKLGEAAREKMRTEYDLRARALALESHYDAVLARSRQRA